MSSIVRYDQRKRDNRSKMNDRLRNRPTIVMTGSHTGTSKVTSTQAMKYVVTVIILRSVEVVETECEKAIACTRRERLRRSVGRTVSRWRLVSAVVMR